METPVLLYYVALQEVVSKTKAQLQANLFAVAGALAQNALEKDVDFDEIRVYGFCCFYKDETAYLTILQLNFQHQVSRIFRDDKRHQIDELIAYALKECNLRNFGTHLTLITAVMA